MEAEVRMEKIIMRATRASMVMQCHCNRCQHVWTPTKRFNVEKGELPNRCPNCNSPYWNRQRTRKRTRKTERMSDVDFEARCLAIEAVLPDVNRKLKEERDRERRKRENRA